MYLSTQCFHQLTRCPLSNTDTHRQDKQIMDIIYEKTNFKEKSISNSDNKKTLFFVIINHKMDIRNVLFLVIWTQNYETMEDWAKSNKIIIRRLSDHYSTLGKVMELAGGGHKECWQNRKQNNLLWKMHWGQSNGHEIFSLHDFVGVKITNTQLNVQCLKSFVVFLCQLLDVLTCV